MCAYYGWREIEKSYRSIQAEYAKLPAVAARDEARIA
jgi:hypothetical protein